jgi:hypothetical protein
MGHRVPLYTSAPPTHVTFYGEGKRLLSAGGDRALRVFSTVGVYNVNPVDP